MQVSRSHLCWCTLEGGYFFLPFSTRLVQSDFPVSSLQSSVFSLLPLSLPFPFLVALDQRLALSTQRSAPTSNFERLVQIHQYYGPLASLDCRARVTIYESRVALSPPLRTACAARLRPSTSETSCERKGKQKARHERYFTAPDNSVTSDEIILILLFLLPHPH
jgi:hypothetical protein